MASLFGDYIAEETALTRCYAQPLSALGTSAPVARAWTPELVENLRKYQAHLGLKPDFQGNEAVIVTGQQPGLFTGPLYTVYKAITAIQLAKTLQEKQGVPCVPLFWIASDDHDFEEVRTAHILSKTHTPLSLRYTPHMHIPDLPMYRMPLDAQLREYIDILSAQTPGSEYTPEVTTFLQETLENATSFSDWFGQIMAGLFEDTPLIFFSPHLDAARQAARPIFEREIRHPLVSTQLINEAGAHLAQLGYPVQLIKGEQECNFFIEFGGHRRKILFHDEEFHIPEEKLHCKPDELLALLESAPERFSANVALRCIVQQLLFPAAAYVAGPGELAYWAQLKSLFEFHQQPMPVVYPRAQAVITTPKLEELRDAFSFSWTALQQPYDAVLEAALKTCPPDSAQSIFEEEQDLLRKGTATLHQRLAALPHPAPVALDMAKSIETHLDRGLQRLEHRLLYADETRRNTVAQRVTRLHNVFYPFQKPQERVYSALSFFFAQGPELIPRLTQQLDIHTFQQNEVLL